MESFLAILFVVGFFALIGLIIFLALRAERKRKEALMELAARMGFAHEHKPVFNTQGVYAQLRLFNRGRSKKIRNALMQSSDGRTLQFFDYQYTTGSGKNSTTTMQTVLMLQDANLSLPPFNMQPESFMHRAAKWFVGEDIDFEAHPEFSRKYFLKSDAEAEVRELFAGRLCQFFEQHLGWSVESDNGVLMVYKTGKRMRLKNYEGFMKEALTIIHAFSS